MNEAVKNAVETLKEAMTDDPDYAWGWHCNIAMFAVDAGCPHHVANEGAARFMQALFGIDTRNHPGFPKSERPEYQQRIIDEAVEMDENLSKLRKFFKTDVFNGLDKDEQERMQSRLSQLVRDRKILDVLISAFK